MNFREMVRETIKEKKIIGDKNGRRYLFLKLSNDKVILAFHNKIKEERWALLLPSNVYDLEIEKNEKGNWELVDFYFVG